MPPLRSSSPEQGPAPDPGGSEADPVLPGGRRSRGASTAARLVRLARPGAVDVAVGSRGTAGRGGVGGAGRGGAGGAAPCRPVLSGDGDGMAGSGRGVAALGRGAAGRAVAACRGRGEAGPAVRGRGVAGAGHSVSAAPVQQVDDDSSDEDDWLEGMDPKTSFKLKIKLLGNRKKSRQDMKCFSFDMVVDSDTSNFKDLVESIVEKYPPGYQEVPHVQYYDESLQSFPEIKSDQELMNMFSTNLKKKVITMFIVYRDPSDPYEPVKDWDFHIGNQSKNNIGNDGVDEDDYLRNPAPQNEHVGVDEETTYLQNGGPLQVVHISVGKGPSYVVEDSDEEGEEDELEGEEDELEGDEDELEGDKKKRSGQHKCPICMDYGHHWHKCKRGRPEDIEAMKAIKGDPKKRARNTKAAQNAIVPLEEDAPATCMSFPPSQNLETTSSKKRKGDDGTPKTSKRSRSGSNQPEALSIASVEGRLAKKKNNVQPKKKLGIPKKKTVPIPKFDSPSMGTRSKRGLPSSPAMSTRSKRRLSL